jgi:hypothetical protein
LRLEVVALEIGVVSDARWLLVVISLRGVGEVMRVVRFDAELVLDAVAHSLVALPKLVQLQVSLVDLELLVLLHALFQSLL